jgi:hypothetical protein
MATIKMTTPDTSCGLLLKKHIYEVYRDAYGAEVDANPDKFVYIEENGEIYACFGITFASSRKLFSEYYLEKSVESYIDNHPRNRIAEVGSCIAVKKGYGWKLYNLLPSILNAQQVDYALVTLTSKVSGIFDHLKFHTKYLVDADVEKVPNKEKWGSFYNTNPKTFIFNIKYSLFYKSLIEHTSFVGLSISKECLDE